MRRVLTLTGKLGVAAAQHLGEKVSSAVLAGYESALDRVPDFETVLQSALERFEPIDVPVVCRPTGPAVDDYFIVVDLAQFTAALEAGRHVLPRLTIYAATDQLDRALLAERLIGALSEVLEDLEVKAEQLRARRDNRQAWGAYEHTLAISEIVFSGVLLCIAGAGAMITPLFWVLVGLTGVEAARRAPAIAWDLVRGALGSKVFRTKEDEKIHRLQQRVAAHRPAIITIVEGVTITVDERLTAERAALQT